MQFVPFARLFYGRPSEYLWEDASGDVHKIPQGEGGEQGDAMMPLLFSLGQQGALNEVQRLLQPTERLFAYHDDIYFVCRPERVGDLYAALQDALRRHAGIQIHCRKTQVWNRASVRPRACDVLERVAQAVNPTARVWRGSMLPEVQQGMKVLGTPLGHPAFVAEHLRSVSREQQVLLDRITLVQDLQSAWLLLLHCASARVNYLMRAVSPDSTAEFAQSHDEAMWQCLCLILRIDPPNPLKCVMQQLSHCRWEDWGCGVPVG